MSNAEIPDSVKYLLLKIAADAANEGRKTNCVKNVENINAAIAYKVLKQHNINPDSEWMFYDAE